MSEFVEIKTSIADIINIANGLRAKGEALTGTMKHSVAAITTIEEHPETLPHDEFTDGFLVNYHAQVKGEHGMVNANEAVKGSALALGVGLTSIGDGVAKGMWAYSAADDDNAADVGSAGKL
jgi:hypothetical protein